MQCCLRGLKCPSGLPGALGALGAPDSAESEIRLDGTAVVASS